MKPMMHADADGPEESELQYPDILQGRGCEISIGSEISASCRHESDRLMTPPDGMQSVENLRAEWEQMVAALLQRR